MKTVLKVRFHNNKYQWFHEYSKTWINVHPSRLFDKNNSKNVTLEWCQ